MVVSVDESGADGKTRGVDDDLTSAGRYLTDFLDEVTLNAYVRLGSRFFIAIFSFIRNEGEWDLSRRNI